MRRPSNHYLILLLVFAMLLLGLSSANSVFSKGYTRSASDAVIGGGKPATAHMVSMHVVDMHQVPGITTPSHQTSPRPLPISGANPAEYAKWKADATHNKSAPVGPYPQLDSPSVSSTTSGVNTPGTTNRFQGMADSTTICPPNGCQPPDMGLAASPQWALQGVNTSFAVYSPTGTLQQGWPKSARSFFGVPNVGTCDSNGAYLSDPRAFYDPNDNRFWTTIFQAEGIAGKGPNCPYTTLYWIGVSSTSDPRGSWIIYSFDMRAGANTTNYADYVQIGFDQQNFYFAANMFNQSDTAFQYAEIFAANKSKMEQAQSVNFYGFLQLSVSANRTVLVDTVQPVETQARTYGGPNAGLFINSFDRFNGDPFNHDCRTNNSSGLCHGLAVWTLVNPGTSSDKLSFAFVDSANYVLPPNADQPGSPASVATLDTRISGTPIYHNGLISFALETNINNGTQNVAGILWGQVAPQLNDDGTLASASLYQQGYYYYSGTGSAYFGALMPDADGDLFMVFEFSNSSFDPGVAYVTRRVAFPLGRFHDNGLFLKTGEAATTNTRWGDYEATSYNGPSNDQVWFAGEYSASNGDWSTYIGSSSLCVGCN